MWDIAPVQGFWVSCFVRGALHLAGVLRGVALCGCIVFLRGKRASPPAPLHSWRGEVDVFAVAQEVVAYSAHAGLSDVLVW